MRKLGPVLTAFLCASCHGPAVVPNRLVAGTDLPAVAQLRRERIVIEQGFGGDGYGVHRLTYELATDNQLSIAYGLAGNPRPVVQNNFRLPAAEANRVRQLLWRLRPQELAREWVGEWPVRPIGCERRSAHDLGEVVVAFSGTNDDKGALFALPTTRSCDTSSARQARRVLKEVVASLPASEIVAEFHNAEANPPTWHDSMTGKPIPALASLKRAGANRQSLKPPS